MGRVPHLVWKPIINFLFDAVKDFNPFFVRPNAMSLRNVIVVTQNLVSFGARFKSSILLMYACFHYTLLVKPPILMALQNLGQNISSSGSSNFFSLIMSMSTDLGILMDSDEMFRILSSSDNSTSSLVITRVDVPSCTQGIHSH